MPVTFRVFDVPPEEYRIYHQQGELSKDELLECVVRTAEEQKWLDGEEADEADIQRTRTVLQTSYEPSPGYCHRSNGFVGAVVDAYNGHQNLAFRPDDIWIAILSQLNAYINAHAEELRHLFVRHQGQKALVIWSQPPFDYEIMTKDMALLLKDNINDATLYDYLMPNFTTTNQHDKVICAGMMMSSLKSYFRYTYRTKCGIPRITLLGTREDYMSLLVRLDRLPSFGAEPAAFAKLLRPILKQFLAVITGEKPDLTFWKGICDYRGGSGSHYLGGWITAFCAWSREGKWMAHELEGLDDPITQEEKRARMEIDSDDEWTILPLIYKGTRYHLIDTKDIPESICEAPVTVDNAGTVLSCALVTGHMGYVKRKATISEGGSSGGDAKQDTLQPCPEWIFYLKE